MDRVIPSRLIIFNADRFGENFVVLAVAGEPGGSLGGELRARLKNRDVLIVFNEERVVARCMGVDTRLSRENDEPYAMLWLTDNAEKVAQPGATIHLLDE